MLWLDIAYLFTKFDHYSFSRSRDMIGAHQKFKWFTWPDHAPFTCYDQPTYQMWTLYLHPLREYERRYKISKIGWFGVVSGHSRSLEMTPFDTAHKHFYWIYLYSVGKSGSNKMRRKNITKNKYTYTLQIWTKYILTRLQLDRTNTKVTMQIFIVSKFPLEFGTLPFCQHSTG